jgi:hypothetical protein
MAWHDSFELANQRAESIQASIPKAVSAHYDRKSGRIVIHLSSKLLVSFSPRDAQGLEDARPSQLDEIEISPSGYGIHFPKVDTDLYLPGLLEGFLGSREWMASRLGRAGGQSRSRAKRTAARANGRLGGRPKKAVARKTKRKGNLAEFFAASPLRGLDTKLKRPLGRLRKDYL